MATALDSLLLANKDHDVLMALVANWRDYPEWITTVAFYSNCKSLSENFVIPISWRATESAATR
jgi:hypothetical protein